MAVPIEDLQSIAAILAAGYLRHLQRCREDSLDSAATSSPHGHEVNASEKGDALGDSSPRAD
jgi:hypothetical protein